MAETTPPTRVDPVRVTEIGGAGTELELVLIFQRTIFRPEAAQIVPEVVPSAAVTMSWIVAKQLRDLLVAQIDDFERKNGALRDVGLVQAARPN